MIIERFAPGVHGPVLLSQVLKQRVVFPKRSVKSLAMCMPNIDKQFANSYAKELSLDAERQRIRCAWALTRAHLIDFCKKSCHVCLFV